MTYDIYCDNTSQPRIRRSRISGGNIYYGVKAEGGLTMESCVVSDCSFGINCKGNVIIIDRCMINWNSINGIYADSASSTLITNNWIYRNGKGIRYAGTVPSRTIRNNTIVNNSYGIYADSGSATITNCIVWNNTTADLQGCSAPDSWTSIHGLPGFVNADGDNYHLAAGSGCIDTGNGTFEGELDIDGEPRMYDGNGSAGAQVDKGADEYYDSPADFEDDDIVNFKDYVYLANAWLSQYNIADLELFAADWLWEPHFNDIPLANIPQFGLQMGGGDGMTEMQSGEGESMMMEMEAMAFESYVEPAAPDPNTIVEVLEWLEEMWLDGKLPEDLSEETYLDFRAALEQWAQ